MLVSRHLAPPLPHGDARIAATRRKQEETAAILRRIEAERLLLGNRQQEERGRWDGDRGTR